VPLIVFSLIRGAGNFAGQINANPSNQNLLELWESRNYSSILSITENNLGLTPMDPYSLLFRGLASYYTALSQISAQEERTYLDHSIISLRKLLILNNVPKKEIVYYTLGKAYLQKGTYYADLALKYLQKAQNMGYENSDTYEYIGEAYSILGNFDQSIRFYEKALERYDSDRLYLKIAEDCFNYGKYDKSAEYYNILIAETQDESLKRKGLFQLGKLYYDIKNLVKARETFEQLNDLDPTSVDAHFLLGETYHFLGDETSARSEWHKTLRIDPEHRGARLRLYN
jgi:tetratricopeptide (TPR) repeat protein